MKQERSKQVARTVDCMVLCSLQSNGEVKHDNGLRFLLINSILLLYSTKMLFFSVIIFRTIYDIICKTQ